MGVSEDWIGALQLGEPDRNVERVADPFKPYLALPMVIVDQLIHPANADRASHLVGLPAEDEVVGLHLLMQDLEAE
ncbi:MAG: hypothetical protein M0T79_01790 [Actinomycetota bacterium]|nr:hypothetical protein [Actinomycetota bacterium]